MRKFITKALKRIVFIVCMLLSCVGANAFTPLTNETRHFVSLHGDLGYSALLHSIQGQKPAAGMNTNIGLDYRLFHNNFLFSVGVEGMYELNANQLDKLDVSIPMLDTEGDRFDMHVLVDKSRDLTHMANINVPILFGGEWGRFYFLVGPKLSLNLYGSTTSQAQVTTYGEYDRYYDDFYNMPNHQFETGRQMSSANIPLKWNMNVMAHLEIGGRFNHMYKHQQFRINPDRIRMYLAAFVDFGVLNIHHSSGGAPIFEYRETKQGVQFFIQPLLVSSMSDNAVFRNMNIGIKYTVAFELPQHGKSYIYDYNKPGRGGIKRGGNQGIKH